MLHLAILRSPIAHARITGIDVAAAHGDARRRRRLHRRRPRRRAGQPALRLADHRGHEVADRAVRSPSTRSTSPARPSRSWSPAAPYEARDALEAIDVDYDDAARRARHGGRASPTAPTWCTPTWAPTSSATWIFDSAEAGTGGDVEEAIADAEVRRSSARYRQQRLIPAFMEPRSVVVDPTGEQITMWSATQIPHILRLMLAADARHARAQAPRDRAGRRRRLRRQAAGHARGDAHVPRGAAGSASR